MPGKRKRNDGPDTLMFDIPAVAPRQQQVTAYVDHSSSNGRHVYRTKHTTYAPSDTTLSGADQISCELGDLSLSPDLPSDLENPDELDNLANVADGDIEPEVRANKRGFATLVHDEALLEWMQHRQQYVEELNRLEGLGGQDPARCTGCRKDRLATYRCMDCFLGPLTCKTCCVRTHSANPFHRIKHWNGTYFAKVTLRDLGLVVQLGHPIGEKCSSPAWAPRSFLVMHTNGFHPVALQFCECDMVTRAGSRRQQLLRAELMPATITDPSTCATFRLLESFHIQTLQGKLTAYDFYVSLEKITDSTGLGPRYERLKPTLRMIRQWRHLKALKRAGRAHAKDGVASTKAGDLCIRCPACPLLGYNLPSNWESVSDELKFVYMMFIAVDANFRLKRRAVSNETRDPALGSGWGYFVADRPYHEFLLGRADEADISTCTGFQALLAATTKYTKGHATSGVGMTVCAQHGFILPHGVGDLQKGERYCNMDYIFASAYQFLNTSGRLTVSYDIACQWSKHLLTRLTQLPDHVRLEIPEGELRYVIPKYHWRAHKEEGHHQYSLNLLPGCARVDGEEIERVWAFEDGVAASTREMGPGSRHDTLEDHFGWSNWRKLTGLGKLLQTRWRVALVDSVRYRNSFDEFRAGLSDENVTEWTDMVEAWERDPSQPDPYHIPSRGVSEAEIRLQLAAEDEQELADGAITLHEVTASGMLIALLDLEEQQRKFKIRFPRSAMLTPELVERRGALRRRLVNIRSVQALYMPSVPQLVARVQIEQPEVMEYPEEQPLFLPHSLDLASLDQCSPGIAEIEARLRDGQLRDSIERIRVHLHIKMRMLNHKARNVRHQGPNTRAHAKLDTNQNKINAAADKYRAARQAKLALCDEGPWTAEWPELTRADVRCLDESDSDLGVSSDGRRQVSWIWRSADSSGEDALTGFNHALRVEFLKTRARAQRFAEQVHMIQAEKTRTLIALRKNAEVWDERSACCASVEDPILRQGLEAYAAQQAGIQRGLAQSFESMWRVLRSNDIAADEGRERAGDIYISSLDLASDDDDDGRDIDGDDDDAAFS